MSGMVRTINSTGRTKILREHVRLRVTGSSTGSHLAIAIDFGTANYKFPRDATVHVEADAPGFWRRFDIGTVAQMAATVSLEFDCPCTADLISFRIKVTGHRDSAMKPLLLGEADGLKLQLESGALSLLPIQPDPDLHHLPWCLDFNDDQPLLRISTRLIENHAAFGRSPEFRSLVAPEVFRQILAWALLQCDACDTAGDSHAARWVRFGCSLNGDSEPPANLFTEERRYDQLREDWRDSVIKSFCTRTTVTEVFKRWWREGAA